MYTPTTIFHFCIALLLSAQLAFSAPVDTDVGICVNYTYDSFDAVSTCLKTCPADFKTCPGRVTACIKKTCGLAETSTLAQNELCVTKLKKTLKKDAPVVNCVRGFVGGCPSYEWV